MPAVYVHRVLLLRWFALAAVMLTAPPAKGDVEIKLLTADDEGKGYYVAVSGLAGETLASLESQARDRETWNGLLGIQAGDEDSPAMWGEHRVEDGRLLFFPRFPLRAGLSYRASLDLSSLSLRNTDTREPFEVRLRIPDPPASPAAFVEAVYPTSDLLPENQLRFYIQFFAPMSRGESYRNITLLDESGQPVWDPFLTLSEELWDVSGRRFTLLVDPGRIKQGLKPREEVGPVFEAGGSFSLLIDASWRDARRRPLRESFRKDFEVGPPDDVQPDPQRWKIEAPSAGTRDPVVVHLDEPLDYAMLQRVLQVADTEDELLSGKVFIDHQETCWRFRPQSNWTGGRYELIIDTALEDRAGNSIRRPFEVDIIAQEKTPTVGREVRLGFDVR